MLSNDEYRNIIWKLDHVPENLHGQQRQNYTRSLRQQITEHEYATKFIPFEPLPHIPYFINRTTTKQCLHQLIKAATVSPEFTLDTESMNIYKKENKPTLIQLQIFLPHHSSCALIIEMYHLPNENHICFKLIKDLIEIIFSQDKKLYTWGSINELKPFVIFKLFSYEQLNRMNPINLQENFKIFWNKQHRHKSSSSTSSNSSSDNCLCEALKHIPGLTNSMPDYLSRSPVDDVEEDPDEVSFLISKSTQTDFLDINNHLSTIAAVQTRAMKLRNQTRNDKNDITILTSDTLIRENRITPISIEQLIQAQQNDNYAKNILNNIKNYKRYIITDNILMRRSHLPVPYVSQGDLRTTILNIYHDTAANGAHFGRDKTMHKIKQRYFWPSIYKDIDNYVKSCILCAQFNPRRQKAPGTLKPIQPPDGVWQLVSMDFHGPITPTTQRGNKYIISLTDVLSKFVITKATRDNTTHTAVRFLKEDIISKFGTPRCILTDNGTHITSRMMDALIKQIGITHLYSTPYHPQTNGQVERYNSTMDAKIAALSNLRKTDWDDQLPFVTFNYNTSIHSSTKQIPFEMMYGRSPVLPFDHQDTNVTLSYDPEHSKKLNQFLAKLNEQAKINIIKNQEKYKQGYDVNRTNPIYHIGDLVLCKTLNIRYKFDIRYEGPFRIITKLTPKTFIIQHIKKLTLYRQVTTDVLLPIFERNFQ
ncbi:unnamed protein product [Rotaria sp. Silwood2]|nr:unnamed protein product [Rotaria sp. Silwood2]